MKLIDIQKPYNHIVSLGSECGPALHLKRHNLRRASLPFDWVCSHSLTGINRLLKTKFNGYMELSNMTKVANYKQPGYVLDEEGNNAGYNSQFIKDNEFNVISVHDFPIGLEWQKMYPSYKQKLTKRIERFNYILNNSPSILFIRWSNLNEAAQIRNEVAQLEIILSEVMKGEFKILIINPAYGVNGISDIEWGIKNVCAVQVSHVTDPITDNPTWDHLLNGISIK
jgi:Putative papain-like cysteine peptidase (DUF1796)